MKEINENKCWESDYHLENGKYLNRCIRCKEQFLGHKYRRICKECDPETIWEELDRFIGSIRDEIRSDDPDEVSIDFWLFKIERRIKILRGVLEAPFIDCLNDEPN